MQQLRVPETIDGGLNVWAIESGNDQDGRHDLRHPGRAQNLKSFDPRHEDVGHDQVEGIVLQEKLHQLHSVGRFVDLGHGAFQG